MNQDRLTPDAMGDVRQPASTLMLIAQAVLALGLATAVIGTLPLALVAGWLLVNVVLTGLRTRLPGAFALWLANGLVWGLGTAAVLQAGGAASTVAAALLAAALAPLLASADAAAGPRPVAAFVALAVLPAAGLSLFAASLPGVALALMLVLAGATALSQQRARTALVATVEHLQSTQRAREIELERLDDEVQRLRVETRAVGESKESLAGELSNATQELAVLRSKAGALSNVLQRINPYDTETGLLTAEKFANVMNREWARMRRQELPLSLLLVSIDKFDEFRERQGRLGYEAALRRISDVLRHAGNRPGDVAARLGPGAFALLFPETEHKHVSRLADSVRQRVRQLGLGFGADDPGKMLTATVGMATVIPNNEMTPETLRERVEAALYEAQFQGGDRSVRYRTMDSIRVEHWDVEQEGQLTADSVRHKLAVLGYDATPKMYKPGEQAPSRRVPVDSVEAVVEGQLKIMLEGEARVLKPGDLLFIPKGLVTSVEVVGQRPVLCLEAIRA